MRRQDKTRHVAILTEIKNGVIVESEMELTDEHVAAIKAAEKELDEGEGIDFKMVAKRLRKKYGIKEPAKSRKAR